MNARFQKVQGHSNLKRDKYSGAILNANKAEIEQARRTKQLRLKQEERIEKLEQDIGDIKSMLAHIVEKL